MLPRGAGARLTLAVALLVGAADAVSPASGPEPAPVADPAPDACPLPQQLAALLPGSVQESFSVEHRVVRNASAQDATVLSLLALARATGETVNFTDAANFTEDTFDTCALNLTSEADAQSVLAALALHESPGGLPPNATLLVRTHTHRQHNVTLDPHAALAAMALANAQGTVHWRDVVSVDDENATMIDDARVVSWTPDKTAADLALQSPPPPADPPSPLQPAPQPTLQPHPSLVPSAPAAPTRAAPAPAPTVKAAPAPVATPVPTPTPAPPSPRPSGLLGLF
jgi:hypothetical protein